METVFIATMSTSARWKIYAIRKPLARIRTVPTTACVFEAGVEMDSLATTPMNASYQDFATVGQIVEIQTDRLSACAAAAIRAMDSNAKVKTLNLVALRQDN